MNKAFNTDVGSYLGVFPMISKNTINIIRDLRRHPYAPSVGAIMHTIDQENPAFRDLIKQYAGRGKDKLLSPEANAAAVMAYYILSRVLISKEGFTESEDDQPHGRSVQLPIADLKDLSDVIDFFEQYGGENLQIVRDLGRFQDNYHQAMRVQGRLARAPRLRENFLPGGSNGDREKIIVDFAHAFAQAASREDETHYREGMLYAVKETCQKLDALPPVIKIDFSHIKPHSLEGVLHEERIYCPNVSKTIAGIEEGLGQLEQVAEGQNTLTKIVGNLVSNVEDLIRAYDHKDQLAKVLSAELDQKIEDEKLEAQERKRNAERIIRARKMQSAQSLADDEKEFGMSLKEAMGLPTFTL